MLIVSYNEEASKGKIWQQTMYLYFCFIEKGVTETELESGPYKYKNGIHKLLRNRS